MSEPIWEGTVDDYHWVARVTRIDDHQGELTVAKFEDPDTVILCELVGLAYGAIFGPDVSDVALWQTMVIEAIDHYNAHHKE